MLLNKNLLSQPKCPFSVLLYYRVDHFPLKDNCEIIGFGTDASDTPGLARNLFYPFWHVILHFRVPVRLSLRKVHHSFILLYEAVHFIKTTHFMIRYIQFLLSIHGNYSTVKHTMFNLI